MSSDMCRLAWWKLSAILEILTACIIINIALMMEAVSTSEVSVTFYQTKQWNIPEHAFIVVDVRTLNLTWT
jgi:hypothetical protein